MRWKTAKFKDQYLRDAPQLNVDQGYKKFVDFMVDIVNKHVPQKVQSNRRNVPWLTRALRRMCRKKQRLYNKARKRKRNSDKAWSEFRSFQRQTTSALRKARTDYINNILVDSLSEKDNKPLYRYLKSQGKENCGVASLKHNGTLHQDSGKKVEILNDKFSAAFTSDDSDPHADTVLEGPSVPDCDDIVFTEAGVRKLLNVLNVKKAWHVGLIWSLVDC